MINLRRAYRARRRLTGLETRLETGSYQMSINSDRITSNNIPIFDDDYSMINDFDSKARGTDLKNYLFRLKVVDPGWGFIKDE